MEHLHDFGKQEKLYELDIKGQSCEQEELGNKPKPLETNP